MCACVCVCILGDREGRTEGSSGIPKEKDISFLLSSDDALWEIKKVIIKNYKMSNFDNKQLWKCLILSIIMQGSLDSAWSSL